MSGNGGHSNRGILHIVRRLEARSETGDTAEVDIRLTVRVPLSRGGAERIASEIQNRAMLMLDDLAPLSFPRNQMKVE